MKPVKVYKTWVKLGNTYCLLMEVDGRIFTKHFQVLYYNEDVVKLNKTLKEHDLLDTIHQTFKIDKIDDMDIYNYGE